MKTPLLLLPLALAALLASAPLFLGLDFGWLVLVGVLALLVCTGAVPQPRPRTLLDARTVSGIGIGTVRAVDVSTDGDESELTHTITVDVENVTGQVFTGRLRGSDDVGVAAALRPGAVLLVTFDPQVREQVWLADDIAAVHSDFDRMLISKGLLTDTHADLIRHGTKTTGVVTGARGTEVTREDHREVVVDLMVTRPGGGQFPAHEVTLIPSSSLHRVDPGSVVDVYYLPNDEARVALSVPPRSR